jgi:beta-glucosidase
MQQFKSLIITTFLLFSLYGNASSKNIPKYQNAKLPVSERVDDLISRMTLEEKVKQLQSQMTFLDHYKDRDFEIGNFRNISHFMQDRKEGPPSFRESAEAINADTRKSIESSRLGIPVLQHGEALHGAQWGNATCFPQCIGMAASFDDEFLYREAQCVSKELRAVGVRQVYAPVINISRDPRWGRTEEGFGEDVFLTSRMGVAYTKGLEEGGVIATPKHFVDNYGSGGHDSYASDNSWRVLRETFLEPFRACIEEGGAQSVMAAYNSIDGVPCSNNSVLLNDILRKEWKFNGFVVSDYGGVLGVQAAHRVADTYAEAQAQCLEAGLDVELPNGNRDLLGLVKSGRITEEKIDESVRRVLTCKFELGLFDQPYVNAKAANQIVRCKEHRDLALDAARKVMTLLKNKNNTLPLSERSLKRIGVFGPAANVLSLGDYAGGRGGWKGEGAVTPYEGLKKRLNGKAEVILYTPGTDVKALASTCDVVIYFAAIFEGEGNDRSHMTLPVQQVKAAESVDNAQIVENKKDLTINMDQEQIIQDLAKSGAKTIVVLQNGSPIDMRNWVDKTDAILEAWYPGEQGGTAIAEALMGDLNPGGRLPFTWPRHAGQIPIQYAFKPSGRGYQYSDDDGKPMFPFGYGLSYTTFEYSNLVLPDKVTKGDSAMVKLTVKNTGTRSGDEVVQLYLHDEYASVVRPLKELKAFKRISLKPGESKEVTLFLPYRSFGLWNRDLKFVVEPGAFKVYVGKDAENSYLEGLLHVE